MKILGIDLAPLNIPMERRLQTVGVLFFVFLFFQGGALIGLTTLTLLFFTRFYWLVFLYIAWYIYDKPTSDQGGRYSHWARNWTIWKYYTSYFPMKLIKTTELSPDKNYLFAVHPHGVMSFSAFGNFGTEATGFSKLFPGLTSHLLVLKEQFVGPFGRELLMLSGTSSASERNLKYILGNKGNCKSKGQVCSLIIGGAAESLESRPGKYKLILKNRRGFIRMALETGAQLVPVFSFGEIDVYNALENPKDSRLRAFQDKVKKLSHFGLPIIWGRGIFNYSFGLLPFRKPIHTVIGKPIDVVKTESPSKEDVDKLHETYVNELIKLFDEHKKEYLDEKSYQLEID